MGSLPLAGRKFARSMGEHLAHRGGGTNQSIMFSSSPLEASSSERQTPSFTIDSILGRPCSSSTELHEGVGSQCVPCTAFSRPPLLFKASQTITSDYMHLSRPDAATSFQVGSSLDSATNFQWDGQKVKPQSPFSQSSSGKKCSLIGRSPRVPFTRSQVEGLEAKFRMTNYLSSREVTVLANQLQVTEARVKIWFQNRRARQRREAFVREVEQTTQQQLQCDKLSAVAPQPVTLAPDQIPQLPLPPNIPPLESNLLQLASASHSIIEDAFTRSSYAMQDLSHLYHHNFHETRF
ncbi:unnamed protein product [Hydatigera taeniaeformis]|uniref:Homeobox domain-containing protein n=1 Tax=Hydatigena taeniaeformis TaxID=6205 RepID=A0A0R3X3C7_HYDTA|nr:unnamed protein product [Hydatigera taeniaeformis]